MIYLHELEKFEKRDKNNLPADNLKQAYTKSVNNMGNRFRAFTKTDEIAGQKSFASKQKLNDASQLHSSSWNQSKHKLTINEHM